MRTLFLLFMMIFMVGCTFKSPPINGKSIEIRNGQRVYTQSGSISATAPNNFPQMPFEGYTRFDHDLIDFERTIPNMMKEVVKIEARTHLKDRIHKVDMLYKKTNDEMEEYERNYKVSDWEKKNNAERGVSYLKRYVDFIGGLKCATRVESSNIVSGVGLTHYQTNCNYFDKEGGAKNIHFDYMYIYTHDGSKFQGDDTSSIYSPTMMKKQFKEDIKEIFDSLVIHDMDREKMTKEGLLYNKKYNVNTEDTIPNNIGQ